jgi:hypothetical protein
MRATPRRLLGLVGGWGVGVAEEGVVFVEVGGDQQP